MSEHAQNAMRIAIPLLLGFYDSPSFSYYAPLDATVAERWVREDYDYIMDHVEGAGALDMFRQALETYCRKLSAAGALANEFVAGRPDDENIDTDIEPFFPGLLEQIATRKIERSDELPALVAMLADRLMCRASYRHHQDGLPPLHSRLRLMRWSLRDLNTVKNGPTNFAYLLRTKDAPGLLKSYTREPYMVVINARIGTTVRSLTRSAFYCYEDIETEPGRYERYLTFSKGTLAIAAIRNEQTLLLFRRHIPVVYVLENEIRIVEYEWNPVLYGRSVLEKAKAFQEAGGDDTATTEYPCLGTNVSHPKRMLISEIRPMPINQPKDPGVFR
jgi:hypothetical protein